MRITKRVTFCAAHSIPGAGKCENIHGHNWEATISVDMYNDSLDSRGFIVDVRDLKEAAFKYDHSNLNDHDEFQKKIPSTENVAQQIADDALVFIIDSNPEARVSVTVHLVETENNSADAFASNIVKHLNEGVFRDVGGLKNDRKDNRNTREDAAFRKGIAESSQ